MASNKGYEQYGKHLTNKEIAVKEFIDLWLDKTQSMFVYRGLPDTIPQNNLEYYLQYYGYCVVAKVNGELYAFDGNLAGEENVYHELTQYTVTNTALNYSAILNIGKDCVLCKNDRNLLSLYPILCKYGALIVENELSMKCALVNMRMLTTITASDNDSKSSAEIYMQSVENGKNAVIASNAFLDSIKVHNGTVNTNYLTQLLETQQYLKASLYNELGINSNYNMKREYIGASESQLNDDMLRPFCDNMLECRKEFVEAINEMYGIDITVEFNSAWKENKSESEKQIVINKSVIDAGGNLEGAEQETNTADGAGNEADAEQETNTDDGAGNETDADGNTDAEENAEQEQPIKEGSDAEDDLQN